MAYKTGKSYITQNGDVREYPKKNLVTIQLDDDDLALLDSLKGSQGNTRVAVLRHLIRNAAK